MGCVLSMATGLKWKNNTTARRHGGWENKK